MRHCLAALALAGVHGLCTAQAQALPPAAPASTAAPAPATTTTTAEDISCGPAE